MLRHVIGALLVAQLWVGVSAGQAQEQARTRRQTNLITAEEIAKSSASTAFDAIRTLRPSWFVARGASGRAAIIAYVDGVRIESLEDLRNIEADRIKECRFLNANDATIRYGTGHPAGAVEVTTKR